MELPGLLLIAARKTKKILLEKIRYIREMELSNSNIKKFLIFFQKKAFLIFREMETLKKFPIFLEVRLSYISGNGNPKKFLIFQEKIFRARKMKKSRSEKMSYISGNKIVSPKHKKFFIFQEEICNA